MDSQQVVDSAISSTTPKTVKRSQSDSKCSIRESVSADNNTADNTAANSATSWPKVAVEYDAEEYELRKRLPARFPLHKNDVYITRKTNFKAQLERCQKLLNAGFVEIYVHGLGAAVNRAINLALQVKRRGQGTLDIAVNTSSVEVTDDLLPLLDELSPKIRVRHISAVHIKIFVPENPISDF